MTCVVDNGSFSKEYTHIHTHSLTHMYVQQVTHHVQWHL